MIAAVDGVAAGLGCDIALACDIRLASARAQFAELFIRVGLIPDGGGTWSLPRIVGLGRALELIYSGAAVPAEEARAIGMASHVFPTEQFAAEVAAYAGRLADPGAAGAHAHPPGRARRAGIDLRRGARSRGGAPARDSAERRWLRGLPGLFGEAQAELERALVRFQRRGWGCSAEECACMPENLACFCARLVWGKFELVANHGFRTFCRSFFALRAKNDLQKKKSTILPFVYALPNRHRQEDFEPRVRRLNHIRCRVVVAVTGLAGFDRAAARAGERDGRARERAGTAGAECDRQAR